VALPHALVLALAAAVASALLLTGGAARRALGAALGFGTLAVPFVIVDSHPCWVFLVALGCLMVSLQTLDLLLDRPGMSAGRRVWHQLALFNTREVQPVARGLDGATLRRVLAWSPPLLIGLGLCLSSGLIESPLRHALRYGGFALFALAIFEVCSGGLRLVYGLFGLSPPRLHDAPHLSTSVREFWGDRWNRIVGGWLRRYCFLPLARRGHPGPGMAWAFAASAAMHTYLVLAALGWRWATLYGLFFLVQIAVMGAERALNVSAWSTRAARGWTWAVMLGASPLFAEPLIRMFEDLVGLASL